MEQGSGHDVHLLIEIHLAPRNVNDAQNVSGRMDRLARKALPAPARLTGFLINEPVGGRNYFNGTIKTAYGATIMRNCDDPPIELSASCTCTKKGNVPAAVGLPEMMPVAASSVRPAGNVPPVTLHV